MRVEVIAFPLAADKPVDHFVYSGIEQPAVNKLINYASLTLGSLNNPEAYSRVRVIVTDDVVPK